MQDPREGGIDASKMTIPSEPEIIRQPKPTQQELAQQELDATGTKAAQELAEELEALPTQIDMTEADDGPIKTPEAPVQFQETDQIEVCGLPTRLMKKAELTAYVSRHRVTHEHREGLEITDAERRLYTTYTKQKRNMRVPPKFFVAALRLWRAGYPIDPQEALDLNKLKIGEETMANGDPVVTPTEGDPVVLGDPPAGTPAPAPTFDRKTPLPAQLPEGMEKFKGKSFGDLLDSHQSLQTKLGEQGDQIGQLNDAVAAGKKAIEEAGKPKPTQEMVPTEHFYSIRDAYIQSGEVPEEWLGQVEQRGVKVDRETALKFLEFSKWSRGQMVEKLTAYSEGKLESEQVSDVVGWLLSGESPFDAGARKTFDQLYDADNYAWFDTVAEAYGKQFGGERFQPGTSQYGGRKMRGRPISTAGDEGFKDSADFQTQLMAVRADSTKTPAQRRQAERELIAKRQRQHGEI